MAEQAPALGRQPGDWVGLTAALLDFRSFPGRHATVMREPRILFENVTEVLSLAAGRAVEGLPEDAELEGSLREAARFFVRVVMLRPSSDHYALLGVTPGFDPATLREHYRMLIRMTHPDFSSGGDLWPADAATRINQANDVLTSAERRAGYDPAVPLMRPLAQAVATRVAPQALQGAPRAEFRYRRAWPFVAGLIGGGVLLAGWLWPSDTNNDKLMALMNSPIGEPERVAARVPDHEPKKAPVPVDNKAAATVAVAAVASAPLPLLPPVRPAPMMADAAVVALPASGVQARPFSKGIEAGPVVRPSNPPVLAATISKPPVAAPQPLVPVAVSTVEVMSSAAPAVPPMAETPALRAPVAVSMPAPPLVQAAVPSLPVPAPVAEPLRMADVQPLLGQLLGAMQSGRGEQIIRLVDRSARQGDGGARFAVVYNRTVSGWRAVKVSAVQFADKGMGDQLVVDGVVLLQLQDAGAQPETRELVLRAMFASRNGQTVLTQLTSGESGR